MSVNTIYGNESISSMKNVNDDNETPFTLNEQMKLDLNSIEVFLRSMLKPVTSNVNDSLGQNFIVSENFSFDPIKRIYLQDFYRSLLSTNFLYNQIKATPFDMSLPKGQKVITNLVKIKGNSSSAPLTEAINKKMDQLGSVEIAKSWFHSNIEFAPGTTNGNAVRTRGLYDDPKLIAFNEMKDEKGMNYKHNLFQVGLLENIFDEEEALFKQDIEKDGGVVNIQTIAFRLTELFARLSNVRLSALFFTDVINEYTDFDKCAALDIFYNLLSMISEANRLCLPPKDPSDGPNVDILFYVDASASTRTVADAMGNTLNKIAKDVLKECNSNGTKVRVGVVRYSGGTGLNAARKKGPKGWSGWVHDTDLKGSHGISLKKWMCSANNEVITLADKTKFTMKGNNEGWIPIQAIAEAAANNTSLKGEKDKPFWRKNAEKILIVMSDEPCDNYTSIGRKLWRIKDADPEKTDPLTTPESKWVSYKLSSKGNTADKDVLGFDGAHAWQFNNKDEQQYYYVSQAEGNEIIDLNSWWPDEHTKEENEKKQQSLKDKGGIFKSYGLRVGKSQKFPSAGGDNEVCTTETAFINAINKAKIKFHYLFWEHYTHDDDGEYYKTHPTASKWEKYCGRKYYARIKTLIIDKLDNATCSRSSSPTTLANKILDIALTGCIKRSDMLTFATAARRNKQRMEMLRPSIFVPTLVSEMMAFDTSYYLYKNSGVSSCWDDLVDEITNLSKNTTFTWFARTGTNVGNLHASHFDSFTGIHLKLLNSSLTNKEIKSHLKSGLVALCNAFKDCLNDKEVLKFLDTKVNKNGEPVAKNLQDVLKAYALAHKNNKSYTLPDVSDLQYALMLERIIAKVYWHLGVTSCGYFQANRPKINIDIGLRFLTDGCLASNELGVFTLSKGSKTQSVNCKIPCSKVPDYVAHFNAISSVVSSVTPSIDTNFILNNVITTWDSVKGKRVVNSRFRYYLQKWSSCPYRFSTGISKSNISQPASDTSYESQVGRLIPNGTYSIAGYDTATADLTCPFASKYTDAKNQPVHECKLRYFLKYADHKLNPGNDPKTGYDFNVENPAQFYQNLQKVPPTCPCHASARKWLTQVNLSSYGYKLNDELATPANSLKFIHSIFNSSNGQYNTKALAKAEEEGALGYSNSAGINMVNGNSPPIGDKVPTTYVGEQHSPVRLVYLDQIINLCKDLFKFNQWIAFNEPYLRTKIENSTEWYYGIGNTASFEPVSCYRFSNFHAMNTADTTNKGKLKFHARRVTDQYITAVNRDLSGETTTVDTPAGFPGKKWNQSEQLDNKRTIPGGKKYMESRLCYVFANKNVSTGLVTEVPSSINRGQTGDVYPFYNLHLMKELVGVVTEDNRQASLSTFEVYVKRFRPIYLPDANDIFRCLDKDPVYPKDSTKHPMVSGWEITPHKYTTDVHFGRGAIIVPMNISTRNSPRSNSFQELDADFAYAKKDDTGKYVSGFCKYDVKDGQSVAVMVNDSKVTTLPEYVYFHFYYNRDWLYPVSVKNHQSIPSNRSALISLNYGSGARTISETKGSDTANEYTRGKKGNLPISQGPTLTSSNLKRFDNRRWEQYEKNSDDSGINSNWLYITATPPDYGGSEVTQSACPLPWVFWHSGRGNYGVGPNYWCYGIAHPGQGHENGFCDSDSRWFAVDRVLGQDPVMMCLAGHFGPASERIDTGATADKFAKGFYDPSCCGTNETWHTHKDKAYGWPYGNNADPNVSGANKNGPRPDKYLNPYDSKGQHVLVGSKLTSVSTPNGLFDGNNLDGRNESKTDYNAVIRNVLRGKPMTWSLWNVIRMTVWNDYNREDWDYNKQNDNRAGLKINDAATLEEKTLNTIREAYRNWWKRFTFNDNYTSHAGIGNGKSTSWPHWQENGDPTNYWEAQRLQGGNTTTIGGGSVCNIEWSGLVADISIIYNEVSDTHDSCLTFYTGSYPQLYAGKSGHNSPTYQASGEFYGSEKGGATGVSSTTVGSSPFRYACSGVDMCRNFMAFVYGGYNSTVPRGHGFYYGTRNTGNGDASGKFQAHSSLPANLSTAKKITTVQLNGTIYTKKTKNNYGTEYNQNGHLKDVYPYTEKYDTEPFDSNFMQRVLLPVYPNWESLHSGGKPLHPDEVTEDQFKQIIFCIAPMTYWEPFYGNEGNPKKNYYNQVGERMMAFCITAFYMGDRAEALVGKKFDNEFVEEITKSNVNIISDTAGHDFDPTQPPWGEALQHPENLIGDWQMQW